MPNDVTLYLLGTAVVVFLIIRLWKKGIGAEALVTDFKPFFMVDTEDLREGFPDDPAAVREAIEGILEGDAVILDGPIRGTIHSHQGFSLFSVEVEEDGGCRRILMRQGTECWCVKVTTHQYFLARTGRRLIRLPSDCIVSV